MIRISPDIPFIEKLQASTGSQLTTCMQCGACTASCSLSEDQNIYPRKQMLMAAWGMKEQLMADPHVWTCHQCGDCTVTCPRGVKPGDILSVLRQEQIAHYSKPGFLSRWMQKPEFLPAALLFPAAVIILILSLAGTFSIPEGPVDYSKFFPHAWLNGSFTALLLLSTIGAVTGLRNFTHKVSAKNLDAANANSPGDRSEGTVTSQSPDSDVTAGNGSGPAAGSSALKRTVSVLGRIMRHSDFNSCGEQNSRSITHFLVFWGFILLLLVTFFAILSTIFWDYPLGFFNPIKIAGNIGAFMLLTGSSIMILNRLRKRKKLLNSYADLFFLVSFWLLTISGMAVEGARFHDWGSIAYHLYFFHLVMVWIIILYFPYTKFAHLLYRSVALIITKSRS